MRSFWSEPFLWIHLAGLAALPLLLEVCFLGLAVGDPVLPPWLEFGSLVLLGITPILWMQLSRPFYIFSLLAAALKPTSLTEDQRRILTLCKTRNNPIWVITGSILLSGVLWQLYCLAPIAAPVTPFPNRGVGLLVAGITFLAANLFLQIPLMVAQVLLTSASAFQATSAYPLDRIGSDFTSPGWQFNQLLFFLAVEPNIAPHASAPAPPSPWLEETAPTTEPTD